MNLKDRGVTVGDLLFLLIIIISTTFIIKNLNKENNKSFNFVQPEILTFKKT